MHDASYYHGIELVGSVEDVAALLRETTDPTMGLANAISEYGFFNLFACILSSDSCIRFVFAWVGSVEDVRLC